MGRYTFDPRIEHTLGKRARKCRTFSVGIQDMQLPPWQRTVARMRGLAEHAHAIRAAAKAYCDTLNGFDRMLGDIDDMQRIEAALKGGKP